MKSITEIEKEFSDFRTKIILSESATFENATEGHANFIMKELIVMLNVAGAHEETIKTIMKVLNNYVETYLRKLRNGDFRD